MPDNAQFIPYEAGSEDLPQNFAPSGGFESGRGGAIRKITVIAVDITERGGLNDK
jgi:hypothetical protein